MATAKTPHLWPIIGHAWAVRQLRQAVMTGQLSHAVLVTGPESVGKRTLTLLVAQALLCAAPPAQRPCGSCSSCRRVESGNHPDLVLVEPEEEGKGVKIHQIRELERFLTLTPLESRYKVAVITHFELATPNAANALLKTLEEPPAYAHIMLSASDADTLLPTIVSRSQHVPLRPVDPATLARGLRERGLSAERADRLSRLSGGRVGWAVEAVDRPEQLEETEGALQAMVELLHHDLPTRFELAQEMAHDDVRVMRTLEYWRISWRDVLLLQTESDAALTYQDHEGSLAAIAEATSVATTVEVLRSLAQAQDALLRHANTRLLLESLFLELVRLPK